MWWKENEQTELIKIYICLANIQYHIDCWSHGQKPLRQHGARLQTGNMALQWKDKEFNPSCPHHVLGSKADSLWQTWRNHREQNRTMLFLPARLTMLRVQFLLYLRVPLFSPFTLETAENSIMTTTYIRGRLCLESYLVPKVYSNILETRHRVVKRRPDFTQAKKRLTELFVTLEERMSAQTTMKLIKWQKASRNAWPRTRSSYATTSAANPKAMTRRSCRLEACSPWDKAHFLY